MYLLFLISFQLHLFYLKLLLHLILQQKVFQDYLKHYLKILILFLLKILILLVNNLLLLLLKHVHGVLFQMHHLHIFQHNEANFFANSGSFSSSSLWNLTFSRSTTSPSLISAVISSASSPITSFASLTSLPNSLESSFATGFKEYFGLNSPFWSS